MMKTVSIIKSKDISHTWSFSRVGGVNRVNLETGMDLINLKDLDQKLWTALSCPVHGLEIDSKTLELIDSDNEQIATANVWKTIEQVQGKATIKSTSVNYNFTEHISNKESKYGKYEG